MPTVVEKQQHVWVLLVERGVKDGATLQLFQDEASAAQAAHRYLRRVWPNGPEDMPTNIQDAIEQYNQTHADWGEHFLLSPWPVEDR